LEGLFKITDRLERFPRSGRIVPEIGSGEFRELVYRSSHRIIYRIESSVVSILTVRSFFQQLDPTELHRSKTG